MLVALHDNGNDLLLREWRRADFRTLSGLPGRNRWNDRNELQFAATGANVQFFLDHFPEARWEEGAAAKRDAYVATRERGVELAAAKRSGDIGGLADYWDGYKTKPFEHQHKFFVLSRDLEAYAALFEQGCGKTKPLIDNAAYLYRGGRSDFPASYGGDKIDALVVIAPNGVHRNWVDNEVPAHLDDRVPRVARFYDSDLGERRMAMLERAVLGCRGRALAVFAVNVESLGRKGRARDLLLRVLEGMRCFVVVDESSRIRTPGAERTMFVNRKVRPLAPYRRIATGTPVVRGAENLYSQFTFLDPRILGYESYVTFKARYCVMGGFDNREVVAYDNLEELTRSVDRYSMRVLKSQCLDLPPKVYKRMPFELGPVQRGVYDELAETMMAEYRGEVLTASLAVTMALRLSQVAAGWWPGDGGKRLEQFSPNPRLDAFRTVLEDTEGKVIVWSRNTADIDLLCGELGREAVRYDGAVGSDERALAVERLQKDPACRFFVAHPQTASAGLTLTAADTAVFYTNHLDLEYRLQGEDRNHRIGSLGRRREGEKHATVLYWDLEAKRTVDGKDIRRLRQRKELADVILGDPEGFFMRYDDEPPPPGVAWS